MPDMAQVRALRSLWPASGWPVCVVSWGCGALLAVLSGVRRGSRGSEGRQPAPPDRLVLIQATGDEGWSRLLLSRASCLSSAKASGRLGAVRDPTCAVGCGGLRQARRARPQTRAAGLPAELPPALGTRSANHSILLVPGEGVPEGPWGVRSGRTAIERSGDLLAAGTRPALDEFWSQSQPLLKSMDTHQTNKKLVLFLF